MAANTKTPLRAQMRSRGGHVDATHRASRQCQAPAREGRESESRVAPATLQGTQQPGQSSPLGDEERFAHAMRQLRVYIRLLSALLVAAVARAVIDGFTLGLTLALALTGVLLVAALWLRRLGSRGPADVVSASAAAARNQPSNAAPASSHRHS